MNFPKTQHKFSKAQIFSLAFPSAQICETARLVSEHPLPTRKFPMSHLCDSHEFPCETSKNCDFRRKKHRQKKKTGTQKPCHRPFSVSLRIPAPASRDIFLHKMFSKSSQTSPQYHCFFPHQPPITLRFLLLFSVNGIITSTNNSRNNIYLPSSAIQPHQTSRQS